MQKDCKKNKVIFECKKIEKKVEMTEKRRLATHNAASIGLRKHNDNGVPQPRGLRRLNVST